MVRIVFFSLLIIGWITLTAQHANVTGEWVGSSTFMKDQTQLRLVLDEEAGKVSGTLFAYNKTTGDSLKARVSGLHKKGKIQLRGDQIVYRTGLLCMANKELTFQENGSNLMLVGRWKGDSRFVTCPPLVSGNVTLVKENKVFVLPTEKISADAAYTEIAHTDNIGLALIRELGKRKFFALIIGINQYEDEKIGDLGNPILDAKKLQETLTNHYSFNYENVTLLENPKREEIIQSLDKLADQVTEKDNLLIFYAGHGIWNAQLNQGYWLPSDASMRSKSFWLSNSTLRDYVRGIKSKHTLLISDACFSGGILKERAAFQDSRAILEVYKLNSRKAMTSGTLKTVPDESVFIKYLVKALANNPSPLISADQLFRSFKSTVINNSPNGQVPQYGPIVLAGDEGGDFVFLRRD